MTEVAAMPESSEDGFEQWLRAPMREESPDPRFVVRRARPADFDAIFDAFSWHSLRWDRFWFPRDARFLNWRYSGHPTHEYRSLALLEGGESLVAYCVLRLDGQLATLMEFAAPDGTESVLLAAAARAARASGCHRLEVFATPDWKRWPLFHRAGFLERASIRYVMLRTYDQEDSRLDEWQLLPGDHDDL